MLKHALTLTALSITAPEFFKNSPILIDLQNCDQNENIIDFSKNPTFGPPQNGFDYSFILPSSLDIPPYLYLENNKFIKPVNNYTDGNKPNHDSSGAFWRAGPMAEDFEIDQVLPTFFDKSKKYIKRVFLFGIDANKLADVMGSDVDKEFVNNMNEAVKGASKIADPDDIVLLAPACSSLDMYKNYQQRGDAFISAIDALSKN